MSSGMKIKFNKILLENTFAFLQYFTYS